MTTTEVINYLAEMEIKCQMLETKCNELKDKCKTLKKSSLIKRRKWPIYPGSSWSP